MLRLPGLNSNFRRSRVMHAVCFVFLLALTVTPLSAGAATHVVLTFEARIAAQEAIERVYYSHQIGATRAFGDAVPRKVLETKVRNYMKQSAAIEAYWDTPVTAQALQNELQRIARDTRFPGRLREVYAALNNDPALILECFARPVLVDRLARSFFAYDDRIHEEAQQEAAELKAALTKGEVDPTVPHLRLAEIQGDMAKNRSREPEDTIEKIKVQEQTESIRIEVYGQEYTGHQIVATYTIPKVAWDSWWHDASFSIVDDTGLDIDSQWHLPVPASTASPLDCESDDAWNNGSLDLEPEGRWRHSAVWTGSRMLIWGGKNVNQWPAYGLSYDPLTDTWQKTSTLDAPPTSGLSTAVWTGDEMLVWGGVYDSTYYGSGGRYNPVTDTWQPISLEDAPTARAWHTAVWTGNRMVIWGGYDGVSYLKSGGTYDPATDHWETTSMLGAPTERVRHTAVWTGDEMLVWGGVAGTVATNTGGRYDPTTDTWTQTSTTGVPKEDPNMWRYGLVARCSFGVAGIRWAWGCRPAASTIPTPIPGCRPAR